MITRHPHTPADVAIGTITLCATSGLRWAHLPVDRFLWADEEVREVLLERVRQEVGDSSAPVEVVE
ncbi:hypothetical protein ACWGHD_04735 [Streptomyces xanthophaeus]